MRYQATKMTLAELIGPAGMISDGDWIESKDQDPEGIVRLVQLADIGEGIFIDKSQRFLTEQRAQELRCSFLQKGDLLIARMPDPIGRACIFPGDSRPSVTAVDVCIVRPDQTLVDTNWLKHAFNSPTIRHEIEKGATGTTRSRIATGKLKGLSFNLPPLEEQKRIAAILDKADSLRRKRAQAIALADDFLRATFLDLFGDPVTNPKGWPVAKLGDVTAFENGDRSSNYPSGDDLIESGVLFLSTKNIINKQLDLKFAQYISKEKFDSLSRGKPKFNDLIITLRGTLGNCCVYNVEDAAFINAQMMIIRPGPKVNSTFLQYFMTSTSINDLFQRIGQGAAVPQLTGKQLSELDVFVPEIDLQNAFESIVKKSDVLIGVMEKANIDSAKLGCMRLV